VGQGHIQKTTGKGTRRIPQVNAQPTAPDTSTSSVANTSFVQNVHNEPDYAQQAPSSNTIIPLPQNATISILTPLGPPLPQRPKVVLGELKQSSTTLGTAKFKITVTGIEHTHPLAGVIKLHLYANLQCQSWDGKLRGQSIEFSVPKGRDCRGVTEVRFKANVPPSKFAYEQAQNAYRPTRNLIGNLQALGFDADQIGGWLLDNRNICEGLSAQPHWEMPSEPTPEEHENRLRCIEALMYGNHFEAALALLSDLAKKENKDTELLATSFLKDDRYFKDPPSELSVKGGGCGLKNIEALVCYNLSCDPSGLAQAGRIVLRHILTNDDDPSDLEPYQRNVFDMIAASAQSLSEEVRAKFLQDLFDLPDIDRADLFRNRKVRFLLEVAGLEELRDIFEQIESRAQEVLWDRKEKLTDKGVRFSDQVFSDEPLEINGGPFDESTIDLLLDFAEAVAMCGERIQWATGVLKFLSERVLDVDDLRQDQLARAKALRNAIQMAVRFRPDPQVAAQFDTIKALTDEAIAELGVWYG
jgi:hypothetical protein